MSTKVSYIHGATSSQSIPKGKARRRFVDYSKLTEGELRLSLMAEQLNILAEYYGRDEYKALEQRVISAVQAGIHGPTSVTMVSGKRGQIIAREIAKARRLTRPAAGTFSQSRNLQIGVNGLIPVENCDDLREFVEDQYGLGWGTWEETAESRACREQNEQLDLLNDHLEGSAHHLLYEYLTNTTEPTPAAKKVLHRNAVSTLASITNVSRENLRLWLRNGVMRNNVNFGADPIQPEDVIDTLAAAGTDASVNGAFLAILPALIAAISGAVVATVSLIQGLRSEKRQQLISTAQGIGNMTFGPEQNDWSGGNFQTNNPPPPEGGDILGGDNLPYLLLGGAALLMMK